MFNENIRSLPPHTFQLMSPKEDAQEEKEMSAQSEDNDTDNGPIKEKKYKCSFRDCTAAFSRPDRLRIHINVNHVHILRFKCTECAESFACQGYLTKHINRVHRRREGQNKAPKTVVKRDEQGIIKRGFQCGSCERVFRRKYQLRLHRSETHGDPMPYKCDVCSKFFALRFQLTRHVKHHIPRSYKCQFTNCDFSTEKWSVIRKHMTTSHTKIECKVCLKQFKRFESLRIHEETKHSATAQRFPCDRPGCDKTYLRESSLRTHQKNSHGEPKFACDQCGNKFRYKKTLREHSARCGSENATPKRQAPKRPTSKRSTASTKTAKQESKRIKRLDPLIAEDQFDEVDRMALEQADQVHQRPTD